MHRGIIIKTLFSKMLWILCCTSNVIFVFLLYFDRRLYITNKHIWIFLTKLSYKSVETTLRMDHIGGFLLHELRQLYEDSNEISNTLNTVKYDYVVKWARLLNQNQLNSHKTETRTHTHQLVLGESSSKHSHHLINTVMAFFSPGLSLSLVHSPALP